MLLGKAKPLLSLSFLFCNVGLLGDSMVSWESQQKERAREWLRLRRSDDPRQLLSPALLVTS